MPMKPNFTNYRAQNENESCKQKSKKRNLTSETPSDSVVQFILNFSKCYSSLSLTNHNERGVFLN